MFYVKPEIALGDQSGKEREQYYEYRLLKKIYNEKEGFPLSFFVPLLLVLLLQLLPITQNQS